MTSTSVNSYFQNHCYQIFFQKQNRLYEGGYSENVRQTEKNGFLDPPKRVLVV